jgi:hypothetical protein
MPAENQDLFKALQEEPFPIRGWHLTLKFMDAANPYLYPVQKMRPTGELPKEDVTRTKADVPKPLFYVKSRELVLTADFRLEACTTLAGQPFVCPKEAAEKQWLQFANTNGALEVILDTKLVPPVEEKLIYPDRDEWTQHLVEWSTKWINADKKDNEARWMIVQLGGIRDSANGILRQSLGRLVERIQKAFPDYWFFAELAMAGRLTDAEIKALQDYELGKGALTIRTIARPTSPATEKVQ